MRLAEGKHLISLLRRKGLKAEIVGGIYKKKNILHDVDLITKKENADNDIDVLNDSDLKHPVELYIVNDRYYNRLRDALRSTTYENIAGRKMKGLKYNRFRIGGEE